MDRKLTLKYTTTVNWYTTILDTINGAEEFLIQQILVATYCLYLDETFLGGVSENVGFIAILSFWYQINYNNIKESFACLW